MAVRRPRRGKHKRSKTGVWQCRRGVALSSEEVDKRIKAVSDYLAENPDASRQEVAEHTGLTPKQVYLVICIQRGRKAKRMMQQERYGLCPGRPETCGPCDQCVGRCAYHKCRLPIKTDQSYTKVVIRGREREMHLVCAGLWKDGDE